MGKHKRYVIDFDEFMNLQRNEGIIWLHIIKMDIQNYCFMD